MIRIRMIGKKMSLNWRGYIVAIGLVALATWLHYVAIPGIMPGNESILYILAIVPTAIFFGFGPAILTCILSVVAHKYFFMEPIYTLGPLDSQYIPNLVIFLLVGMTLSLLTSNVRRERNEAVKETTARKQSDVELTERSAAIATMNTRFRTLSHRLIEIQEEERGNIARELHDQIGQPLNVVKMLLDRAGIANGDDRQGLLSQAGLQLAELIDRVSLLSLDLRPRILDDLGLIRALEWYFDRFTTQTNMPVQFEPSTIDKSLHAQIANTIYRVVQEALTNIARHAHATTATVELKIERNIVQLLIKDDGIGFDPAALPMSASGGIIGMQERINLLGGTLQIQSEPGAGTCLVADIPYQNEAAKEERQA